MKKVFIIGLDGAPYKEIKEWLEASELPFLSRLANEGAFGKLKSCLPPLSMVAWPILFTGKKPAETGPFIYKGKEIGFDPDYFSSGQFINSTDIKTWTIWEWISQHGAKVGVLNIPMTYTPKEVNGFLITGFTTPKGAENFTYPPELREELTDYIIDIVISKDSGLKDIKLRKNKLLQNLVKLLEVRTKWTLNLI